MMASKFKNSFPNELLKQFDAFTSKPELFLQEQSNITFKIKSYTKTLYDCLKQEESNHQFGDALPELIIDDFDEEQVWQQLELQNKPAFSYFIGSVSKIIAAKDRLTFTPSLEVTDDPDDDDNQSESLEDDDSESNDSDINTLDDEDTDLFGGVGDSDADSDADLKRLLDVAEEAGHSYEDSDENEQSDDDDIPRVVGNIKEKMFKPSVVDDDFFKLSEMESFLTQEDLREERRQAGQASADDNSDDDAMFRDDDDQEGEDSRAKYSDYFGENAACPSGSKQKKKVQFFIEDEDKSRKKRLVKNLLESDSEGEDADEILGEKTAAKSGFEMRQERMQKKISSLEAASLADKPWQMIGEVTGTTRPENSLLQEDLDFDHASRLPPVITEETTVKLEDIIRQRVKDKAWDDVERKVKTKENPFEYKKRITLSQEKSKQSLSEIYAQEYLKQNEKEPAEKVRDPQHAEIEKMMQTLFLRLDALSNFFYTPKPAIADLQIVTNMPSIAMEEVAPVSVSDGQLLAPEEIKAKKRGLEVGKSERTETDRLRERRLKKADKRKRIKEKEKRQKLVVKTNPGLGNKYSKDKALKQLEKNSKTQSAVTVIKEKSSANRNTSSKQFFQQLQDEVTTQIRSNKSAKKSKTLQSKSSQSFKL